MLAKSNNTPTKKTFKRGDKSIEGTNLSDAGLGDDVNNPTPAGVHEAGGFSHFQNSEQPEITHNG